MKKEILAIALVLVLGIAAAVAVGVTKKQVVQSGHDHHGHGHGEGSHGDHEHEGENGPNGGKILREGKLELEVVIFEKGGPPHFRVYPSSDHKPVDPQEVRVSVQTERLGDKTEVFHLKPGPEFLYSDRTIEEPHSFFMKVEAQWKGEKLDWEYSQYEGRLTLPDDLITVMGIRSDVAGPGTIRSSLELPGEIAFNADLVSHIVPRVPGVVMEAYKNLGDSVKVGEVLALIDSRELGEARSRYLVAFEREKLAHYNFERSRTLWEKQTVPEKELLTAQKTHLEEKIELTSAARKLVTMGLTEEDITNLSQGSYRSLTHFAIKAPFDGVVVKKHCSPGEWVKEDAEILVLADLSTVWVEIIVYANDLNAVHMGQKAKVKGDPNGREAEGIVSYVGPLVGEESRTARARVVIANPEGRWRPGEFVRVHLIRDETSVPVLVRNEAIQTLQNRAVVFAHCDDQFEARPVALGRSDGQWTEVCKGLDAGERYVTRNSYILKSELGKAGMSHQH
jgi:membrane fusion protein, heavy metal efflux system